MNLPLDRLSGVLTRPVANTKRNSKKIWRESHLVCRKSPKLIVAVQEGKLYKHLRRRGKKRNSRGSGYSGRGHIPGRIDITERPQIVEDKRRVGDWEADTIVGAGHRGALVSVVDRASKFTVLHPVSSRKRGGSGRGHDGEAYALRRDCTYDYF